MKTVRFSIVLITNNSINAETFPALQNIINEFVTCDFLSFWDHFRSAWWFTTSVTRAHFMKNDTGSWAYSSSSPFPFLRRKSIAKEKKTKVQLILSSFGNSNSSFTRGTFQINDTAETNHYDRFQAFFTRT